jgi:hypothetical protein
MVQCGQGALGLFGHDQMPNVALSPQIMFNTCLEVLVNYVSGPKKKGLIYKWTQAWVACGTVQSKMVLTARSGCID